MNIKEFAAKYGKQSSTEPNGAYTLPGKQGVIYDHNARPKEDKCVFGVYGAGDWAAMKKKLQRAGCTIHQDGDYDGSALFDPANEKQAKLALELIKAKPRRELSEEHKRKFVEAGKESRIEKPVDQPILPQADAP